MHYDIVVHNGIIITVNPSFDIIENGLICIREGRFAKIGPMEDNLPLPQSAEMIDAQGGIIMPGLINTHTHLPMTIFRGLADDLPLDVWLNENIFPAEAKHINPDTVRWATLLACAELILSGTTTCCDGYFLEDHVAEAVKETGIRAILGQGIIDFPAPGVPDPADNVKTAQRFMDKWQGVSPLITPSIFAHTPYTCSKKTLQRAKKAATKKGALFQIHAAETRNEKDRFQAEHQMTPIQYLDHLKVLDSSTLLVHCIWLNAQDIDIIAARKSRVSHNPESNMKLSSGIAPVPELLKKGITVGLGTDGCASNNNLDLFHEMDIAAKLHKADMFDPTVMDARTVLKMATIGGAKAIGFEQAIGSLEVGKQADLIVVDTRSPHMTPMYHPASHIVYTAKASDVRDVIVSGSILLRNRTLLTLDLNEIMQKVRAISEKIRA